MTKTRKLAKPPFLRPKPFSYYQPVPIPPQPHISKFRKPRPTWIMARPGMRSKPYLLAEPFPGLVTYTPPPTVFHRKVVKKPKTKATTENNLVKIDITTVSPWKTTEKYYVEPFYIHEAIQAIDNNSSTTESSYNTEPFYIQEALSMNNGQTDFNKNASTNLTTIERITASYIWQPLPIFAEEKNKTKLAEKITSDYLVQPRKLFDLGRTFKSKELLKGHYVTRKPKVSYDSKTMPIRYNQVRLDFFPEIYIRGKFLV